MVLPLTPYGSSPFGSPVFSRGMFQSPNNQFGQMMAMRANLGRDPSMVTRSPIESPGYFMEEVQRTPETGETEAPSTGQMDIDRLNEAILRLQQQQENLSRHLGATPNLNARQGLPSLLGSSQLRPRLVAEEMEMKYNVRPDIARAEVQPTLHIARFEDHIARTQGPGNIGRL